MLAQAFAILVMLAILSILIIVHEIGHFSVARLFGFQTPVFGFGLPFGPHMVVGRRWGTEFRVHACLLGGYVAIPELGDESASEDTFGVPLKPFRKFPIWQRALVAFAGVGFNILFAYLVMFSMFVTLGQPSQPVVVHALIDANPIARDAGIAVGDKVVSIDNRKVSTPDDVVHYLVSRKNTTVTLEVHRKDGQHTVTLTTNKDGKVGMALISKGTVTYQSVEGNIFEVAGLALVKLWSLTANMVEALGQLVSGLFAGGAGGGGPGQPKVGIEDLHGVLAVVKIGADIAQQDWSQLFLFTIMISMDLAIINLVPWPALDGGHLAFMAVEAVRGRPMGERAQGEIVKWGFISLIVLMAIVMVNDVTALFTGKLNFKVKKEESSQTQSQKPGDAEKAPADSEPPADKAPGASAPGPAGKNTDAAGSEGKEAKPVPLPVN